MNNRVFDEIKKNMKNKCQEETLKKNTVNENFKFEWKFAEGIPKYYQKSVRNFNTSCRYQRAWSEVNGLGHYTIHAPLKKKDREYNIN